MRISGAKELFRQLTKLFFSTSTVIFANQSRIAKPRIPLVVITPGNVKRPRFPTYDHIPGETVGHYLSMVPFTVDLFTNGAPVIDDDGSVIAYEDTALDDMLAFEDFLNSNYTVDWCHSNDVAVMPEGDVIYLTGVVNDTNYEYRSRLVVNFYFTQTAVGNAAVFTEDSVKYPTYEKDPETGEVVTDENGDPVIATDPETGETIYSPEPPEETTSSTGDSPDYGYVDDTVIVGTPIDGVAGEFESDETYYFSSVEIKEV